MISTDQTYDFFLANRALLLEMLNSSQAHLGLLGMKGWQETISQLTAKVNSDRFKVLVLGEFKRGKSTLINALLGEEVLPAFATPCTAIINEVKWGEKKKAIVHLCEPLPDPLPESIPIALRKMLESSNGDNKIEIPIDQLEDYVVISDPAKDHAQSVAESPFDHVEIYWPLDLCRNGVEIIDSPGLNEHGTRTKITMDYLTKVDAVLFVMSCQALASQTELQVIDNSIRAAGHEDIFFIANRFNEIRERDRDRVMTYCRDKLKEKTALGVEGIYFISALPALEGRLAHDIEMVNSSGILPLEKSLARFLTNDRGRIKLLQSSRELIKALREAKDQIIPSQLSMLEKTLLELEERYKRVSPRLHDAERRRRQIVEKIERHRDRLKGTVRREAVGRMRDLSDLVVKWTLEYKPENKYKFFKFSTKEQLETLAREVADVLSSKIEESQNTWIKSVLEPLVQDHLKEMTENVEQSVKELLEEIDSIKAEMSGFSVSPDNIEKDISTWERVLSAAGGFIVGGIGSAMVGGILGFKEMMKSLGPQIALVVGMMILGITNPIIFIGALLAAGTLQGFLKQASITEATKKKVGEELAKKLTFQAGDLAEKMSQSVFEKTEPFSKAIAQGLDKEIQSVHHQVAEVLREKAAGEESVAAKKVLLEKVRKELNELDSRLMDFIFSLSAMSAH